MSLTADRVRIAGTGEVFVAPDGTASPTDTTTGLNAAYVGLGYTESDGVSLTPSLTVNPINAWQSVYPVRRVITATSMDVQAKFLQSNATTMAIFLGASSFAANTSSTVFTAAVPTIPVDTWRAMVIQWTDTNAAGTTITTRLWIARVAVSNRGALSLARAQSSYDLTFSALAPGTGSVLANWITDDQYAATTT